jgi:hypothetical protein
MNVLFARADNNHIKSQLKYLFWNLLETLDKKETRIKYYIKLKKKSLWSNK